jgi:hypothetical protein
MADPRKGRTPSVTDSEMSNPQSSRVVKVVVATTVLLSFISFWRAAAIVLSDLASSAYYAGGIAETAIGKSARGSFFPSCCSPTGPGDLHRELQHVRQGRCL